MSIVVTTSTIDTMVGGKGDVGDYQARASIAAAELESPEPEKLASGRQHPQHHPERHDLHLSRARRPVTRT